MIPSEDPSNRERTSSGRRYLESAVSTASPARLRLMLIERAVDVARLLAIQWRAGESLGANEYSLCLLGLLTELLSGVTGGSTPTENRVCRRVADLYVFLTQHLVAAEPSSCVTSIDEIRLVLEAERETWRAVCAAERRPRSGAASTTRQLSGGLNLQG